MNKTLVTLSHDSAFVTHGERMPSDRWQSFFKYEKPPSFITIIIKTQKTNIYTKKTDKNA